MNSTSTSTRLAYQQAQKMDACQAVSRSFIHDLKNHLGGISGAAELLNIDAGDDPSINELTTLILSACDNAMGALKTYVKFLEGEEQCEGSIDINEFIQRQIEFYQACLSKYITIALKCEAKKPHVEIDACMLGHMCMNIVLNTRDAIQDRGSLSITTSNISIAEHARPPFHQVPPGRYLDLCFADTGCGMNQETLEQASQPHFSSKPRHIGMGLTLVHDTMRQHKGYLCVESNNAVGTKVHLLFPQVQ